MSKIFNGLLAVSAFSCLAAASSASADSGFAYAMANGKTYGDFRLRYESVEQDNLRDDATALTLRSMLGYSTGTLNGFSATVEFEDVRIVAGEGDYSADPAGYKPGEYSVIADAETTELDQGFVQYKSGAFTAKAGRQVLTYDGHRFVGHVGWRQDRQTFDGLSINYQASKKVAINLAYLDQRNLIFAEAKDVDSSDTLLNVSYQSPIGKVVGYSYLLEDEDADLTIDTYGLSLNGTQPAGDINVLYALEYATQSQENAAGVETDADYMLVEGGVVVAGLTLKLGYEVLGSDDGMGGFQTPLATLHKFNGWADIFLKTPDVGLVDSYLSVGGKVAGGAWALVYHEFTADEDDTLSDHGTEVDAVYSRPIGKNYYAGIKYAAYSADETAVDTDKLWVWVGAKF